MYLYPEGRNQKKHTLFSFSSDIGTQYGVSVPGWPRIEPGDKVTAILIDASNWQTLQGWVNHRTKEIAVHSTNEMLVSTGLCFFCAWLFYLIAFGAGGSVVSKVPIIFICLFSYVGVFGIVRYTQQRKICKALRGILENPIFGMYEEERRG